MSQRVYLVIMDETEESRLALRFASRRAVRTGGIVHIVAIVPQQTFSAFAVSRRPSRTRRAAAPKCW